MSTGNDQSEKQITSANPAVQAVDENVKKALETALSTIANLDKTKGEILVMLGLPNNVGEQLQRAKDDLTAMTSERDEKARQLTAMTSERDAKQGELASMTTERDNLQTSLKDADEKIAGLNQGMDRLEDELNQALADLEEAQKPKRGRRAAVEDDEDEEQDQGRDYLWFLRGGNKRNEEED